MVWIKRLNNSDTGDSTHLGGDHWDTLDKYFDDTDIEGTTGKPAKVNTETWFKDGKLCISNGTNTYTIKMGTLSGGDVDLTLPSLAANGTLLSTGGSNVWVASQTFTDQLLKQLNPAGTFSYIHKTSAILANRQVTWPLLTANDEVMMKDFGQTPTNKTIGIDTNTVKHSTTNAEGDLMVYTVADSKYSRKARGTADQVLQVAADGNSVGWRTFAAPAGNNFYDSLLPSNAGYKFGIWSGTSATNGYGLFAAMSNIGGTATPYVNTTGGNQGLSWAMTSSAADVGIKITGVITLRKLNPDVTVCFQMDEGGDNTGSRSWIGFTDNLAGSLTSATYLNNDIGFLLRKSNSNTFFDITSNDGGATQTSTGSVLATDSGIHTIRLVGDEANSRWSYSVDGASLTHVSAEIPIATDSLGFVCGASQDDSTSRNFRIFWMKMKQQERV